MKIFKIHLYVFLTGAACFQGCKKDAGQAEKQDINYSPIAKSLATTSSDDFSSITWGSVKSQPILTHEVHGDVVNGKLYIFGGYDVNKKPAWTPTKKAFVYDPIANTWKSIADLPHTPSGQGFGGITHAGVTNDGSDIYIAGGYTSNANGTSQLFGTKQVWRYNISTNTYTRLPDLPQSLATGQLRFLNGKIHYMGGANLSRQDVNIHLALDLSNLTAGWQTLASLNNPANHPGSAVYNGKIYFLGGAHEQNENTVTQKTLEVYDEATNTWTNLAPMPVGRDHIASSVVVMGSRIIVLGGETSHNVLSKLVSAYSPATNTWAELTPLNTAKSAGVAGVLDGNIYYTGGNFAATNRKGVPVYNTTETILLPTDDAYVRDGSFAADNYGLDTILFVKASTSSGFSRKSYLKFSLSDISSVNTARLRIYGYNADNSSTITISCYSVDNDSWTEQTISQNNAPSNGTTALSTSAVNNVRKYIEFDVTNFVKAQAAGDKLVSFAIRDAGNTKISLYFNSGQNNSNKPQLIIN
ncbi:DNRLRE domain-containing protein [Pedobacter sp. HMF7647]|uniref:DNRLRE domain-containing protein n=1 Tax=Hufsiella arboris TaxID=2695275 RepID=A0A7K1Y9X6_9SPHI|nr:DNRLRE domain-containing protein [Hufsiella arboris]MXV50868.1 DNRLRE domain-containing protein [Hufsiella arboris]